MYKLVSNPNGDEIRSVCRIDGGVNTYIPFDPANTDYQAFKQDLANGVALSDAEGTTMTADQIKTFLQELK